MAQEPNTTEDEDLSSLEEEAAQRIKSGVKVELDLDDAPFLEDEPELQEEPAKEAPAGPAQAPPQPDTQAPPPDSRKKRKLILAGIAALALLLVGVGVNILLSPSAKKPEPTPQPAPETVVVAPKILPPAETPLHTLQWEPFWVQLKDTEGAVRFLSCKFSTTTENTTLFAEMIGKRLILRDALFYYLQNQPILSLSDEARATRFKDELMNVINEHLGSGKVSELLLEEYLIQ